MDEELKAVKEDIVDSKSAAKWVELSDHYIDSYNKNPEIFVLPTVHAKLAAVIKAFHKDLAGFQDFIKTVRDSVDESQKLEVHELYRKITSRLGQQVRRERLANAILLIERELTLEFTFGQKEAVGMWLTQYWGKARMDRLEHERKSTPNGRLSTDIRADICDQFWDEVDTEIKNGIVPIPPEIVYVKLASLESHKPNRL